MSVNEFFEPVLNSSNIKKEIDEILKLDVNESIWIFRLNDSVRFVNAIILLLFGKYDRERTTVKEMNSNLKEFLGLAKLEKFRDTKYTRRKIAAFIGEFVLACARTRYGSKLNQTVRIPYTLNGMRSPTEKGIDLMENLEDRKIVIWESKASIGKSDLQNEIRNAWDQATTRYVVDIKVKLRELNKELGFHEIVKKFADDTSKHTSQFVWVFTSRAGSFRDTSLSFKADEKYRDWLKKVEIVRNGCVFEFDDIDFILKEITNFLIKLESFDGLTLLRNINVEKNFFSKS